MAHFEVWKDGAVKMRTDHSACVPSRDMLLAMARAGCTFRLDEKRFKPIKPKKEMPHDK